MPYYRRGYRRGYGRSYRRWYGRRGWTRSWRGGMTRRIQSGTRTFSMVVPVEGIYTAVVPAHSYNTVVGCVSPYFYEPANAHPELLEGTLVMSELYRTYCKLYDEVKIDWVSWELSVLDVIGQGGVFSACRLWTTIDRKFTRQDLRAPPTAYQVRTASSAKGIMMVNNSRTVTRRYIAATDLQERTTWHDCDVSANEGNTQFYDIAWYGANENLGFFCPACYYFMELNNAPGAQTAINLSIKVKYGVTFRNAKFGLSAAAPAAAKVDGGVDFRAEPVKTEVAGKSESVKPTLTGMAKDALGRLALNVSDVPNEYETGENDWHEDLEFLISKVGVDGVRSYFPEGSCVLYDDYLKERGVMDDDPTEVVKDAKS